MLCVSVFVLRFPLFCKFVFVFCRSSDEVEGERRLSSPLMFSINFKSVLQFPSRSPFQFLQTLQSAGVSKQIIKKHDYTSTQIEIHKYTNAHLHKYTNTNTQIKALYTFLPAPLFNFSKHSSQPTSQTNH